jgi:predicted ATP-grasp superfamily ATP-dependent carboligase
MSSIEIVELTKVPVKNRTVVTGLAGAGFIGNTALMHAVRAKGFKQVGYVHGTAMPPMMILVEGKPSHSFRIYTDPSDEYMFLVTESILQAEAAWEIGHKLIKWLKGKGLKEIIALEGFPFAQKGVFGFTTGVKNLQGYGIQPISDGAMSGVNASLLFKAMEEGIAWTTIFVPARLIGSIDYQGAFEAVQVLNTVFNMEVEAEQLKRMSEAIAKATELQQQRRRGGGFLSRIVKD